MTELLAMLYTAALLGHILYKGLIAETDAAWLKAKAAGADAHGEW